MRRLAAAPIAAEAHLTHGDDLVQQRARVDDEIADRRRFVRPSFNGKPVAHTARAVVDLLLRRRQQAEKAVDQRCVVHR